MLNNVLQPDEVSPRRGGMQDDIYGGVGSQYGGPSTYSQLTPSPAVVQPPARLPTPAQAFERRLAENPIVPAGAFGGSKVCENDMLMLEWFLMLCSFTDPLPSLCRNQLINPADCVIFSIFTFIRRMGRQCHRCLRSSVWWFKGILSDVSIAISKQRRPSVSTSEGF